VCRLPSVEYTRRTGLGVHDRTELRPVGPTQPFPGTTAPSCRRAAFSERRPLVPGETTQQAWQGKRRLSFCTLRTFFRSPARDAGIFRGEDVVRPPRLPPVHRVPVQKIRLGSVTTRRRLRPRPSWLVAASNLVPRFRASIIRSLQAHPDARQHLSPGHHRPVSGRFCEPPQEACGTPMPFPSPFRHVQALDSRVILLTLRELKLYLRSEIPGSLRLDPKGLPRFPKVRHDRGGLISIPAGWRCLTSDQG